MTKRRKPLPDAYREGLPAVMHYFTGGQWRADYQREMELQRAEGRRRMKEEKSTKGKNHG